MAILHFARRFSLAVCYGILSGHLREESCVGLLLFMCNVCFVLGQLQVLYVRTAAPFDEIDP